MRPTWWVVCVKELRETLRDRRTLLMMIVVPVLLYPVLLIVMEQLLLFGIRNLEAEATPVAVIGEVPPSLASILDAEEELRTVSVESDPEAALRTDSVAAVAVIAPPESGDGARPVTLLFDEASDRSNRARGLLVGVLDRWNDTLLAGRLEREGLSSDFVTPVAVSDSSIARPEEVGGYALGRILPLLLVVITLLGAFYPAIDLAAGEKERATLETLMTAPVPARDIVAGKFVTVALIGVVAAGLNLGSMLLTFQTGLLQVTAVIGLEVSIPLPAVAAIFVTLIPLAVLFGAIFLGIAVRASSFKEAQNALTPVYMLVLIPAMLPIFPGIDFGPIWAVTPVAGVSFFFRDLMTGDAELLLGTLVIVSTSLWALAALGFASHSFGSERVLFGSGEAAEVDDTSWLERWKTRRASGAVPSQQTVVLFVAGVAVLFFWVGIQLQIGLGERGLLAAQWLLLLVPALSFVRWGGFDWERTLSLRAPSAAGLLGSMLLILGTMPLVWAIGWLQTFVFPVPWEMLEGLEELVTADTPQRLAWLLFLVAVTPAICEEMVFRGVLLGGTRTLHPVRMIVLNGVVFGAFHLSFETVIRFMPTAVLGMVIAFAVWRTGSIFVGMAMHFFNNGAIVVLVSIPALREAFSDPNTPPPLWLIPIAAVLFAVGLDILLRRIPRPAASWPTPSVEDA